jgi:poly-gamma-glutamate synthesis protein (capsule biosynthesis protein)
MIKFMALGDIMLSANRGTGEMIKQKGPHYLFDKIRTTLAQADLLFANLECPVSDQGVPHSKRDQNLIFRADADSVEGLKAAGFHVLSIANNHILDYGNQALLNTVNTLEQAGIRSVGVEAESLHAGYAVIRKNEIKVAFTGYNAVPNPKAKPKKSGGSSVKQHNLKNFRADIQHIKSQVNPDIIIVSSHWGASYCEYPIPFQMELAREMIDRGAHIILGHHPHLIQGTEKYKNGIIVYSLGELIFDEPFPATKESFIFSCNLSHQGFSDVEYIPVVCSETFQPVLAEGTRKEEILKKIKCLSEEYKSRVWINSPSKNPTEAFFFRSVREGLMHKNLLTCLNIFPKKFLLLRALPLFLSKIFKKSIGFFKRRYSD